LYALGYYFSLDMLYLCIYLPVSIAGIIFNTLSEYIFFRPAFYSASCPALYSYLRYEAVTGIVGNLIATVYSLEVCSEILPFMNNYVMQWIQPYIVIPMYNVTYYVKFLIEIVIVLDRILILAPSFGSRFGIKELLTVKRPFLIFIGVWTFSLLIDLPYFYPLNAPAQNILVNYGYPGHQVFTYYSYSKSAWSLWSNYGYFIMLCIYIFKNLITFVFETTLNVFSIYLFQRHLAQKARLTHPTANFRHSHSLQSDCSTLNNVRHVSAVAANKSESSGGKNMAKLVLVISITGFIHNSLLLTFTVYYLVFTKPTLMLKILQFVSNFASTLRHAINFVQFYFFNSNFRKEARLVFANIKFANNSVQQASRN
jgi:hypothetical protein